ncbi:hypothetical protein C8F04DRAFT_1195741 [Mycena alexandri]|uniref:Uncharacterized protein n=1 Tax=Mycena alexandri TaxID=1745969 RepID=A0AAD6WNK4_9AGAR|nr:hypothetical protein C8F04DRAFT_1195741 [Mycena alexandri]
MCRVHLGATPRMQNIRAGVVVAQCCCRSEHLACMQYLHKLHPHFPHPHPDRHRAYRCGALTLLVLAHATALGEGCAGVAGATPADDTFVARGTHMGLMGCWAATMVSSLQGRDCVVSEFTRRHSKMRNERMLVQRGRPPHKEIRNRPAAWTKPENNKRLYAFSMIAGCDRHHPRSLTRTTLPLPPAPPSQTRAASPIPHEKSAVAQKSEEKKQKEEPQARSTRRRRRTHAYTPPVSATYDDDAGVHQARSTPRESRALPIAHQHHHPHRALPHTRKNKSKKKDPEHAVPDHDDARRKTEHRTNIYCVQRQHIKRSTQCVVGHQRNWAPPSPTPRHAHSNSPYSHPHAKKKKKHKKNPQARRLGR